MKKVGGIGCRKWMQKMDDTYMSLDEKVDDKNG